MNLDGITVLRMVQTPKSLASVQAVIEAAPEYYWLTSGAGPKESAARSLFETLPAGKTHQDKYVLGIWLGDKQVGVVDIIRGFPLPNVAMLGLLLLSESHQRSGLGRAAYKLVEQLVRTWQEILRVRIGVVETNAKVVPYWQRMGFEATGETKPYSAGLVVSRVIVLERNLQSAA